MAKTHDDTLEESGRKPKASQKTVQPDAGVQATTPAETTQNSIQFVLDEPAPSGGPSKRGSKNRGKLQNAVVLTDTKAAAPSTSRIPDSVYERFINVGKTTLQSTSGSMPASRSSAISGIAH